MGLNFLLVSSVLTLEWQKKVVSTMAVDLMEFFSKSGTGVICKFCDHILGVKNTNKMKRHVARGCSKIRSQVRQHAIDSEK